jgi:transposase-like protein
MAMTRKQYCPSCESEQTFTRAATTNLNVGLKIKWRCDVCGRQTVQIGDEIDTATA